MFKKTIFAIIVLMVATSPIWAQYEADEVVIDINDGEIEVSADDFYRHLEGAAVSGGAGEDGIDLSTFDNAIGFVEDIVKARALVAEANKQGYPDEETAGSIEDIFNSELREAATAKIKGTIEVSESEINDYYNMTAYQLQVSIIIVEEEELSRSLYDRLQAGEDFSELAGEFNIDDGLKETKGEIPRNISYQLEPSIKTAFEIEAPGGYTEPMLLPNDKWIIVYLRENVNPYTEENPRPELEDVRDNIKGEYIRWKAIDYIPDTLDSDLADVDNWRDEELYQKVLSWPREQIIGELIGKDIFVSRIGGKALLLDKWWSTAGVEGMTDEEWDKARNNEGSDLIEKRLIETYNGLLDEVRLVVWAEKYGIAEDKDIAWDIWRKSSEKTLDNFTESELLPIIPVPSDEEVSAYFASHRDEYFQKEQINGRLYAFKTEEEANQYRVLADDYIPGINFGSDELLDKIREDYGNSEDDPEDTEPSAGIYLRYQISREPELKINFSSEISDDLQDNIIDIVEELETSTYSPVYPLVDGRYGFFWGTNNKPYRLKDFDEVEDQIYRKVKSEIMDMPETGAIIDEWIENITSQYPYTMNENIARVVYDQWQVDNTIE